MKLNKYKYIIHMTNKMIIAKQKRDHEIYLDYGYQENKI